MKTQLIKQTLLVSIIFLTSSCALAPKKEKPPEPKTYGKEVEDEFSSIENDHRAILNYYQKLREENWEQYKNKGQKRNTYQRRYQRPKKQSYKKITPRPTPPREEPKPPEPLAPEKIKGLKIEIDQYMSYYCMENRKSTRFDGSADCSAYTQNILNECEKKHPIIHNRAIVNCVKSSLR